MSFFGFIGRLASRLFAIIGFITVFVMVTPVVSWWAQAYSGPIEMPKGDVLILLSAASDDNGGISHSSYWRARHALLAWQTGGFKRIVISGGGGPGILDFLVAEGIPRSAIVAEWNSTTTRESAIEAARLVKNMPGRKVLLTSDFHMFRALAAFRKVGVDAAPMAVPDVLHSTEHWNGRFGAFETMVFETVKIVYYAYQNWL